MGKFKKVLVYIIRDLTLRLMAVVIVGAILYFVAVPRLQNLIQNVGRPIAMNNHHEAIQTNQPSEKK